VSTSRVTDARVNLGGHASDPNIMNGDPGASFPTTRTGFVQS
jgi:hypothetical protein